MESNNVNDSNKKSEQSTSVQDSRRRLLQAMVATPLVASIPSRSAWGSNCSISGMLSGNLSRQPGFYECRSANGKSPGFWKTHPGCWPLGADYGDIDDKNGNMIPITGFAYCDYFNSKGKLRRKVGGIQYKPYSFSGGSTLNDLLSNAAGAPVGGFSDTVMSYLENGPSYEKHVSAAMLSAMHPATGYPYTPAELANAVIMIAGDSTKEGKLDEILQNLQDGMGSADAPGLVTRCL